MCFQTYKYVNNRMGAFASRFKSKTIKFIRYFLSKTLGNIISTINNIYKFKFYCNSILEKI
jgi:hypothetical protein